MRGKKGIFDRFIRIMLSIGLVLTLMPTSIVAADGTIQIASADDLVDFAERVNMGDTDLDAVLTSDIDLSGVTWTGIANNGQPYSGTFDGNGHTISNLSGSEGLFKDNAGTIKNVWLENVDISRVGGNIGAVAGHNTGLVSNCVSSGTIEGIGDEAWSIGGIVGHNQSGSVVACFSSCNCIGGTAGGLVGSNHSIGSVKGSVYVGTCNKPVEGDRTYGTKADVFYRNDDKWYDYNEVETDFITVFNAFNEYVSDYEGYFFLKEDSSISKDVTYYMEYRTETNSFYKAFCFNFTLIDSSYVLQGSELSEGWYVVEGDVVFASRISIENNVNIILKNGAALTVDGGIGVSNGAVLTIYSQSFSEEMGKLKATGTNGESGIGSDRSKDGGVVVINGGNIKATGDNYSAGIGDGNNSRNMTITINGGDIEATGGIGGVGIGGSNPTITINGGNVCARAVSNSVIGNAAAGIGGGWNHSGGTITINGGMIKTYGATGSSDGGAGIGASNFSSGGVNIIINDGVIYAEGGKGAAGIGDASNNGNISSFSTGKGNAVILASSISYNGSDTDRENWQGLIFENGKGQIYSEENFTVTNSFTIPEEYELVIGNDKKLTVAEDIIIINNGDIQVEKGGTYEGSQPSGTKVTYQIAWDIDGDGKIDETTYEAYDTIPQHDDGYKNSTPEYDYQFNGWYPSLGPVSGTEFYSAQFTPVLRSYLVTLPNGEGYTIKYDGDTSIEYGNTFIFEVQIADGYSATDEFKVMANGEEVSVNSEGKYVVTVNGEINIAVEGVKDIDEPSGSIIVNGKIFDSFSEDIDFDVYDKNQFAASVNSIDNGSGVKAIEYLVSDRPLSEDQLQTVDDWQTYNGEFVIDSEGRYIVYVKITDNADNIAFRSTSGLVLDKTAPIIKGISDQSDYYVSQKVSLSDENCLATISVNGEEETLNTNSYDFLLEGNKETNYLITVTDKAGNSTECRVSMYPIASLAKDVENISVDNVTSDDADIVDQILTSLNSIDVEDATSAEKAEIDGLIIKLSSLKVKINSTLSKIDRYSYLVNQYDIDKVVSEDLNTIEELHNDITSLVKSGNLTVKEKTDMEQLLAACEKLSDRIEEVRQMLTEINISFAKLDPQTVNSDDTDVINDLIDQIEDVLDIDNLTLTERNDLKDKIVDLNAYLELIQALAQAGNSDAINKVENINSDNYTLEDKKDLEAAKEAIEEALKNYGNNYTDSEKERLESKLDAIEDILDAIADIESIINDITALPKEVETDDIETERKIVDIFKRYDLLNEREKEMISVDYITELNRLFKVFSDYEIIYGDNSSWLKSSGSDLIIIANGAMSKLEYILIDNQKIDAKYYSLVSGSTVLTLRSELLEELSTGKHILTFVYKDGETATSFEILIPEINIPVTGDNHALWMAGVSLSLMAVILMSFCKKKGKN